MNDLHTATGPTSIDLESINDDCLREICKYINIFEVVQLASTCARLKNFIEDCIFPKISSEMELTFTLQGRTMVESAITLNTQELEKLMKYFGGFVRQLTIRRMFYGHNFNIDLEKILDLCPHLSSLHMCGFDFTGAQILIHVSSSLKVLKLELCNGITNDWSDALKRFSGLEQISITGSNKLSTDFFKHSHNLSSLTLNYDSFSTKMDRDNIFKNCGQSIRQLKLSQFINSPDLQSIGTLIVDKLPKLEYLAIQVTFSTELENLLSALPHLKSLKVSLMGENVCPLLRKLSDLGTIEDLNIELGVVCDTDANATPLVFNKLQTFRWWTHFKQDPLVLFNAFTRSQMPVISSFHFIHELKAYGGLLELFDSKKTLQSMIIACDFWNILNRNTFVIKIIEILNRNRDRPFLNLEMNPLDIELELVSKIRRI